MDAYRLEVQQPSGAILLGNDSTLALITAAGEVLHTIELEDLTDVVTTSTGEVIVSDALSNVLVLSQELVPTGRSVKVGLTRATSLFPDYDSTTESDTGSDTGSEEDGSGSETGSGTSGTADQDMEGGTEEAREPGPEVEAFADIIDLFYADGKLLVRTASDDVLVYQ